MEETSFDITGLVQSIVDIAGLAPADDNSMVYQVISVLVLLSLSACVWAVFRILVLIKLPLLVVRSKGKWDDHLHDVGFFRRLANITPGVFLSYANPLVHDSELFAYELLFYASSLYIIVVSYLAMQSLLSGIDRIYQETRFAKKAPITGFIQVGRLLTTLVLVFLILSLLMGQSPIYLLSGLTAIAAVLLLIFRDTILGFVSGIQIAANRMFNTGDWIEISKFGIDGEIKEIGLTIVKVQNWDKTISTIPTFALTSDAVKNWRGISLAKGRRIKRSVNIDINSIQFATSEQLDAWSKFSLLKPYLAAKASELSEDQVRLENSKQDLINSRKLTNIGTFRAYIELYIRNHPAVNHELTSMVRHLKPTEVGLPLEVYCFSSDTTWVNYEHLQADIFDHILATMPTFGLRPYQRITNDRSGLVATIKNGVSEENQQ